jgi:hypothetical protein
VQGKIEGADRAELSFDERGATIAGLLALLPGAAEQLGGATIDGQIAAHGKLRRAAGKTSVEAFVRLKEAKLQHESASLRGAPAVVIHAEAEGSKLAARVEADLGAATISAGPYFSKPAGHPTRVAFAVHREGARLRIDDASAALPGVTLDSLSLSSEPGQARLDAAASIALGPLLAGMPLLAYLPPAVSATTGRFRLDLAGDPAHPEGAILRVPSLEIASTFGHVRGALRVDGLPQPRALRIDILGGELDLGGDGAAPAMPDGDTSGLKIDGHIHLDSIRVRGVAVQALDADVSLDQGRLLVQRLHAGALGGTIDAENTWVDRSATPSFDVHAALAGIDLARLPGVKVPELRGKVSGRVDVHGAGAEWATISRSLQGTARLALREVHAKPTVHPNLSLVNPILSEIAALLTKSRPSPESALDFDQVAVAFDVGGGMLTTTSPLSLKSPAFDATLEGQIGLDRSLALQGQIDISPSFIRKATEQKIDPPVPVPLHLKISGTSDDIRIELIELRESVRALRGKP